MPMRQRSRRSLTRWVAALTAVLGGIAMTAWAAGPVNPLEADRWQHRPLVVATPDTENPAFRDLMDRLDQHADGFRNRDMVRYVITPHTARRDGESLITEQREALARAIDADPAEKPELILVGKDGGVKMRGSLDTEVAAIFERIDRMPMRRREMRE